MKRTGILLLGLALTAVGCVELPIRMDAKPQPAPEPTVRAVVEMPPVTPEQVNDDNAPKVLNALREELDRSANERTVEEPKAQPAPTGPRFRGR